VAFGVVGVVIMLVLSRMKMSLLKKIAWPTLGVSIVLLLLVMVVGTRINGNRNWIDVGSFSFQPSEAAKFGLSLWMATVLARKAPLLRQWRHVLIPVLPVAALITGLIAAGNDLGTAMLIMMITAAALYYGGAPLRLFLLAGGVAVVAVLALSVGSGNRTGRISAWLGNCDNGQGLCDQAKNGIYAIASGGWFGLGLGQSRQKYSWIPEAHNDFIFSIIGEELGLVGSLVVLALFGVLAVAIFRVVTRHTDPFVRIVSGTVMIWILGEAVLNISMVIGLLPVIGVPLPLISYGGSALICSLAGIGVVLSFARAFPESDESSS
jgi:cell division protein FtsW